MNPRIDFSLTPEQRTDAREALRLLDGSGISLAQAARTAIAGKRALRRATVRDVASEFLRTRLVGGCRRATFDWYDERLNYITDGFGNRIMDDVTRAEFLAWFAQSSRGPSSKAGIARAGRALWRWAIRADPPMAAWDVTVGLTFSSPPNSSTSEKFLSVDDCRKILEGVGRHRSAVALMLFAGIRPEEVAGDGKPWLAWKSINVSENIIRIHDKVAKVSARVIEGLPAALWAWLEPRDAGDNVAYSQRRTTLDAIKRAAGFGPGRPWPQDALRHTFATYAMALLNDPGRVATWLGHNGNPTMLHRHYRGLATRAEAEKFFALRPAMVSING